MSDDKLSESLELDGIHNCIISIEAILDLQLVSLLAVLAVLDFFQFRENLMIQGLGGQSLIHKSMSICLTIVET